RVRELDSAQPKHWIRERHNGSARRMVGVILDALVLAVITFNSQQAVPIDYVYTCRPVLFERALANAPCGALTDSHGVEQISAGAQLHDHGRSSSRSDRKTRCCAASRRQSAKFSWPPAIRIASARRTSDPSGRS